LSQSGFFRKPARARSACLPFAGILIRSFRQDSLSDSIFKGMPNDCLARFVRRRLPGSPGTEEKAALTNSRPTRRIESSRVKAPLAGLFDRTLAFGLWKGILIGLEPIAERLRTETA
jgi:hypothetical protein